MTRDTPDNAGETTAEDSQRCTVVEMDPAHVFLIDVVPSILVTRPGWHKADFTLLEGLCAEYDSRVETHTEPKPA